MPKIPSVKKIATTLWEHKKKSVFLFVCVGALGRYLRNRERDRQIFRRYCVKALEYGNENILAPVIPRRITVLVRDTKARTVFEKHAFQLLNLAGWQVDVVVPQESKQLTMVASVLTRNDADVVYIVGNDETVSRVLTGLLKKSEERQQAMANTRKTGGRLLPPIGILFDESTNKMKSQCDNAMAVIRGLVKDANVLQVKVKEADPVWTLNGVQWGRFADTELAVPRYWYWGPLKNRMAYFWKAFAGPPESIEAHVRYVEPCLGCSKCYVAPVVQNKHWLLRFLFGQPRNANPAPDYSKVVNENCGAVHSTEFETVEVIARNDPESAAAGFDLTYGPQAMGETKFMREGWARCKISDPLKPTEANSNTVRAREAEITFKMKEKETEEGGEEEEEKEKPPQLVVGGELVDLADFSVKTIPKAIQLITSAPLNS